MVTAYGDCSSGVYDRETWKVIANGNGIKFKVFILVKVRKIKPSYCWKGQNVKFAFLLVVSQN